MSQSRIAILGAGNVGGALGRIWQSKGHSVVFGVPRPDETKRKLPQGTEVATVAEAAEGANTVALCVPWNSAKDAVAAVGDWTGKILIDCVNPLLPDLSALALGTTTSAAETIATWAPGARVVKAFNTIGAVNFGNAQFGAEQADGFYCGDDQSAKEEVARLIEEVGLHPVDMGPLKNARGLEAMAFMWIDLAIAQKQGPDHAFRLLRR